LEASCPTKELSHIAGRVCICGILWFDQETPTIKILKIAMVLRIVKSNIEIFLNFWNGFEMIGNLKTLHILHDPGKFVIFIEVEKRFFLHSKVMPGEKDCLRDRM